MDSGVCTARSQLTSPLTAAAIVTGSKLAVWEALVTVAEKGQVSLQFACSLPLAAGL